MQFRGDPTLEGYTLINGFKGASKDVPIPLEDLEREYCRLTAMDYPITEMIFARSWMLFRVSVLSRYSGGYSLA